MWFFDHQKSYLRSGGVWILRDHDSTTSMKNWVAVLNICNFHSIVGKIHILTNIFQRGWFNHINEKNNGRSLLYHSSQAPCHCWRNWGCLLVSGLVKQLETDVWLFLEEMQSWEVSCTPWKKSHFEQKEVDGSDDFPFLFLVIFRWTMLIFFLAEIHFDFYIS